MKTLSKFSGILFIFFLLLISPYSYSESAEISQHMMTENPLEDTACGTPLSTDNFTITDETAYWWLLIDGVSEGDAVMQDEVFGPLMALISYNDLDELVENLKKFKDFENPNYYNIQVFKKISKQ